MKTKRRQRLRQTGAENEEGSDDKPKDIAKIARERDRAVRTVARARSIDMLQSLTFGAFGVSVPVDSMNDSDDET